MTQAVNKEGRLVPSMITAWIASSTTPQVLESSSHFNAAINAICSSAMGSISTICTTNLTTSYLLPVESCIDQRLQDFFFIIAWDLDREALISIWLF
jgi:hypothetical protein